MPQVDPARALKTASFFVVLASRWLRWGFHERLLSSTTPRYLAEFTGHKIFLVETAAVLGQSLALDGNGEACTCPDQT